MRLSKWRNTVALVVCILCIPIALVRWTLGWVVEGLEIIEDNTWRRVADWANRRLV